MSCSSKAAPFAGRAGRLFGAPYVSGKDLQPLVVEVLVDQLQQRPHEPLRKPRIALGIDPACRGDCVPGKSPRRWKRDVGADTVVPVFG